MPHSWLFGGLTGFAVCIAATALQSVHREANARDSAAGAGTGAATAHTRAGPNVNAASHIGARADRTIAAANANGPNDVLKTAAEMRSNPHYRFPNGSPYPNPSPTMPGNERPYVGTNNALSPGSGINRLRTQ
jgi:hypothetical protein